MSAGTLTLTNNSDLVSGAGTSFSTELTAGDFVFVRAGGVAYTLPVKSVESDTEITLIRNYPGPTQQNSAWNAVPREIQNQVTAALVVQSTEALRGLNYDKQNWQAVFSASGNITVYLPDGTSFSGPSWKSIAETLSTLDVDYLNQLATQINQDAQQVEADKNTVVDTASQVSTDAQAASSAATGAQGSASDAAESETNAEGYKDLARKYALNPEDNPVTGSEYSALHYSEKAKKSAAEAASHNPAEALVKSLNLSDLADRAAAWLNVRPLGSTPLAGDAVNPYDAPTLRQVENMFGGGGGVGPTLNGVQNFGVGDRTLWDSRAFIPAWALPQDGQIVNRADWPELWAHAQMHTPIDDTLWISDVTQRGKYSSGDGSTTFRIPDTNGVQSGSIRGLYGRGDGGGFYVPGTVFENGAPDVVGSFRAGRGGVASGAFAAPSTAGATSTAGGTGAEFNFTFALSAGNAAYGRSPNEVRGNGFAAVWIVRASGGFVAANTSWSVINGDSSRPATGVTTDGGLVRSQYKIGGAVEAECAIGVRAVMDGVYGTRITTTNATTGISYTFSFSEKGVLGATSGHVDFASDGIGVNSTGSVSRFRFHDSNQVARVRLSYEESSSFFYMHRYTTSDTLGYSVQFPISAGTIALQGTSGIAFKHNVTDADVSEAVNRINALRMVNFIYNDDEQARVRFGIIAEEAEKVAPQYIKHNPEIYEVFDADGSKTGESTRDRPSVDNNPIVMDLLGYVKHLKEEIEMLKTALNGK